MASEADRKAMVMAREYYDCAECRTKHTVIRLPDPKRPGEKRPYVACEAWALSLDPNRIHSDEDKVANIASYVNSK